jgi:hypothetical protein
MAFLSDELLKIGRQMNYNSSEDFVYDCLNKMVKICFDSISGNTDKTKETIIPNFKRVHNTWNQVAKQLKKEGRNY